MAVRHPTRLKNPGWHLSKHLELSETWRAFTWNKRREKRLKKKATCMKHKAARVTSRLDELAFGMFNVRTAAINVFFFFFGDVAFYEYYVYSNITFNVRIAAIKAVNDIGHIDTVMRPYMQEDVVLSDCRRPTERNIRNHRIIRIRCLFQR